MYIYIMSTSKEKLNEHNVLDTTEVLSGMSGQSVTGTTDSETSDVIHANDVELVDSASETDLDIIDSSAPSLELKSDDDGAYSDPQDQVHLQVVTGQAKVGMAKPHRVTENDVGAPSIACEKPSNQEGGDVERDESSFSVSVQLDGEHEKHTLYVYPKKASNSDSEVLIEVVSLTSVNDPQEGLETEPDVATSGQSPEAELNEDELLMISEEEREPIEKGAEDGESSGLSAAGPESAKYSCEQCDFTASKKHIYLVHQVVHAIPNKNHRYPCPECSYTSRHRYNLKTHVKTHADPNELDASEIFKCEDCDYTTRYKHDLETHSKKHDPDKQYRCFQCDFASIYKHSLQHHISSKHQRVRPYQCTLCSYATSRNQDLKTHMYKHSKEKPYKCTECNYETPYSQSFKCHMNRHKGTRPFRCSHSDCDFSTTTKANLKSHLQRHSARVYCEACGYKAATESKLSGHKCRESKEKRCSVTIQGEEPVASKKEDGTREYRCTECEYKTPNKYAMRRHNETHDPHRQKPAKMHRCDNCDYVTAYKNSLKRHQARHSVVKPYKCGHCSYTAINMSQMHLHIAKHTGIKPFLCEVCSYATANKQHLKNHMAKHSTVRLKCNKCPYMTAWKDRMRVHLKQHAQGRIIGQSVKPGPVPGSVPLDGTETMLILNQLAEKIAVEFRSEGQGGGHSEMHKNRDIHVNSAQPTAASTNLIVNQEKQALIFLSNTINAGQEDSGEGHLLIATDQEGQKIVLPQTSDSDARNPEQIDKECSVKATLMEIGSSAVTAEISGDAT